MADGLTITPAETAADLAAVRRLCWDYRAFLLGNTEIDRRITEAFYPEPAYAKLMDNLAGIHARPDGIILLARLDGVPTGCGMSHKIAPQTSEIKRVFVDPAGRRRGIARSLCQMLLHQARADGFTRVQLDTSRNLAAAQALYHAMGFVARGPYQPVPEDMLPELRFFEYDLRDLPA